MPISVTPAGVNTLPLRSRLNNRASSKQTIVAQIANSGVRTTARTRAIDGVLKSNLQ